MANANLEKVDLIEVVPFQNGERANADNLNRPIIQLRDNITNQKGVLDSVIDMLSSNNTSLDDLQEVADFIESNKEELRDLTALMNDGGKLRLDNRLGQTDVEKVTYDADGDLDIIRYKNINFYNPADNSVASTKFDVVHSYNDDKLLTKVEYKTVTDTEANETKTVAIDKITVDHSIKSITSITIDDEVVDSNTYTFDGTDITFDDNTQDEKDATVVYIYEVKDLYAKNEFTYENDNIVAVNWTTV